MTKDMYSSASVHELQMSMYEQRLATMQMDVERHVQAVGMNMCAYMIKEHSCTHYWVQRLENEFMRNVSGPWLYESDAKLHMRAKGKKQPGTYRIEKLITYKKG